MNEPPFRRDVVADVPGIVGARWWQKGIADPMARRAVLKAMIIGTVALGAVGVIAAIAEAGSAPKAEEQRRKALAAQREFGWSFGAATENLVFDGESKQPFDRAALAHLADDLAPTSKTLAPFYVPTLFQSVSATAQKAPTGDTPTTTRVGEALRPISTDLTIDAYAAGQSLAALLSAHAAASKGNHLPPVDVAVIVDLPGPEAVAFAAGAAQALEPVFLLDNWPHPRGVVPAHLTLGSAAYYQPLFVKAAAARPEGAPPLFVLDRNRLAPYSDDSTQFDNRHVAQLPDASKLPAVKRVLYVAPSSGHLELDDLNDDLLAMKGKVELRIVGATLLDASDTGPELPGAPMNVSPRVTQFSSGRPGGGAPPAPPPDFGTVPVMVQAGTSIVLGAKLSRSGSWLRSTSSWGGG